MMGLVVTIALDGWVVTFGTERMGLGTWRVLSSL